MRLGAARPLRAEVETIARRIGRGLSPRKPVGGHPLFSALFPSPAAENAPYAHGRAAAGPLRSSLRSRPSPISPAPPGEPCKPQWHDRAVVTDSLGWLYEWKADTPANAGRRKLSTKNRAWRCEKGLRTDLVTCVSLAAMAALEVGGQVRPVVLRALAPVSSPNCSDSWTTDEVARRTRR
jgi:hypothetical protein